MMRSALLTGASLLLTAVVIGNAYFQRQQFYPSVVYITKSNPSMAVIYVQAFVFVILFGKLMRKLFFGSLRAAEFEHLLDRSWYAVTETCLAFTVFKWVFHVLHLLRWLVFSSGANLNFLGYRGQGKQTIFSNKACNVQFSLQNFFRQNEGFWQGWQESRFYIFM